MGPPDTRGRSSRAATPWRMFACTLTRLAATRRDGSASKALRAVCYSDGDQERLIWNDVDAEATSHRQRWR